LAEHVTPIGERLGSERLYDENLPPPPETLWPTPVVDEPKPKARRPRGKVRKQPPPPVPEVPGTAKRPDVNWRDLGANALQLTGVAAITVGCAMIAAYLAFIVGGILLVVLGVAIGMNVT